jgi:hypothetical protein
MTTEADYTPDEWRLLVEAPGTAALAVIAADKSGIFGMAREITAVSDRLESEHEQAGTSNELIAAVLARAGREESPGDADAEAGETETSEEGARADTERAKADAIERARGVATLLAAKSTPEEADGFKRWLLTIAETAANASKEGGFLGIGGTRVSEDERAALEELKAALGVT